MTSLADFFYITSGVSKGLSEQVAYQNRGNFPVISSQTTDDGVVWKVDEKWARRLYSQNIVDASQSPCLTWTKDGVKAGTFFKRNNVFLPTSHCGVLRPKKSSEIDLDFALLILPDLCKPHVVSQDTQGMLGVGVMSSIVLTLPSTQEQKVIVGEWRQYQADRDGYLRRQSIAEDAIKRLSSLALGMCN